MAFVWVCLPAACFPAAGRADEGGSFGRRPTPTYALSTTHNNNIYNFYIHLSFMFVSSPTLHVCTTGGQWMQGELLWRDFFRFITYRHTEEAATRTAVPA